MGELTRLRLRLQQRLRKERRGVRRGRGVDYDNAVEDGNGTLTDPMHRRPPRSLMSPTSPERDRDREG